LFGRVQLYKAIRYGPPCIMERINRGPPKPWEQQLTEVQVAASEPSHVPNHASWAQLPDANLSNAFMAARAAIPGPTSLPRWQMVSTVLGWMEAQEVALAWAVVQYAELVSTQSLMCAQPRTCSQVEWACTKALWI
jgi:hypothetical protein